MYDHEWITVEDPDLSAFYPTLVIWTVRRAIGVRTMRLDCVDSWMK